MVAHDKARQVGKRFAALFVLAGSVQGVQKRDEPWFISHTVKLSYATFSATPTLAASTHHHKAFGLLTDGTEGRGLYSPRGNAGAKGSRFVDGQAYMTDDSVLYSALERINQVGMCRITDLGTAEGTVCDVAQRIGPVSHQMLYGEIFDVVTQENARNIAYTSEALPFHMDLMAYESPPGLQFLHCIQFDEGVEGGQSLFLDAMEAARYFRDHYSEHFEVLCRVPATFQKVRAQGTMAQGDERNHEALKPAHMVYRRPHIQVDANGEIVAVTWSPMFEGVLMCAPQDVGPYYEAHATFQTMMTEGPFAEKHTIRMNMEPGDCMVFNNRRLVHGRTAIKVKSGAKNTGRRLQGTYVNIDDTLSRFLSLRTTQLHSEDLASARTTRFGNGSSN